MEEGNMTEEREWVLRFKTLWEQHDKAIEEEREAWQELWRHIYQHMSAPGEVAGPRAEWLERLIVLANRAKETHERTLELTKKFGEL